MIRLGLQTITWRDPQDHLMPGILDTTQKAGFDGVEIGWRRVEAVGITQLKKLLEEHGLGLSGSHAGGNLENLSQASEERQQIEVIAEGVRTLGSAYLLYSGARFSNEDEIGPQIELLNRLALSCAGIGIQLLYHNHEYEFEFDQAPFQALMRDTVPELGFAPDVGWIHKAGMDVIPTLEQIRDRIQLVHFKDFNSRDLSDRDDTCLLGEGVVPLKEAAGWVKELDRDELWVIAEQDFSRECSADEAARRNGQFLQSCFRSAS